MCYASYGFGFCGDVDSTVCVQMIHGPTPRKSLWFQNIVPIVLRKQYSECSTVHSTRKIVTVTINCYTIRWPQGIKMRFHAHTHMSSPVFKVFCIRIVSESSSVLLENALRRFCPCKASLTSIRKHTWINIHRNHYTYLPFNLPCIQRPCHRFRRKNDLVHHWAQERYSCNVCQKARKSSIAKENKQSSTVGPKACKVKKCCCNLGNTEASPASKLESWSRTAFWQSSREKN